MLPSADASRFGEEQGGLREFNHDTSTMFGFFSEWLPVSIHGVGADHVFYFYADNGVDGILDFETRCRVVDIVRKTSFHR